MRLHRPQLKLNPQRHKKHRYAKVHQRVHPPPQVFAIRQLRKADPGQERADLQREVRLMRQQHHHETPCQTPDEDRLRRLRRPGQRTGQQPLGRHQHHAQQQQHPPKRLAQPDRDAHQGTLGVRAQARQKSQDENRHEVLHQEDPHRNAAVEAVQLLFLVEQLHHHHRATERERHRQEQTVHPAKTHQPAERQPAQRCEDHLPQPRNHRHRPHIAHLVETELEPNQKQQQRNAHLGDQFQRRRDPHQAGGRAKHEAGEEVGNNGGHADPARQRGEHRPGDHDEP